MIFQLCIDESGYASTDPTEVFFLSGYLAKVSQWEMYTRRWAELLNSPPRLTAKGLKHLLRTSRNDKRIECFVSVIKECGLAAIGTQIPNHAYLPVIAELETLSVELNLKGLADVVTKNDLNRMKNSYHLGFWGIAILMQLIMKDRGVQPGTLNMIYDYNKAEGIKLRWAFRDFKEIEPELAKYFQAEPSAKTDDDFMPLQAADLLAWHMHRDCIERQKGKQHEDSVWEMLRTSPSIAEIVWTEDMIREACHIDEIRKQWLP